MAVLGFSTEFPKEWGRNGGDTRFPEKILGGIYGSASKINKKYLDSHQIRENMIGALSSKIHTLRKASKTRKEGSLLHMAINVRTPEQHQFAEPQSVVSIQKVKIKVETPPAGSTTWTVSVDGNILGTARVRGGVVVHCDRDLYSFIRADGFDNTAQFCLWFDKSASYDLIHWTSHRY